MATQKIIKFFFSYNSWDSYLPFPNEKARDEAYDTHVKLFLKAEERKFMEKFKDKK